MLGSCRTPPLSKQLKIILKVSFGEKWGTLGKSECKLEFLIFGNIQILIFHIKREKNG